jgi:cytochrome c-type biogenesis protein CcmH/NrfF
MLRFTPILVVLALVSTAANASGDLASPWAGPDFGRASVAPVATASDAQREREAAIAEAVRRAKAQNDAAIAEGKARFEQHMRQIQPMPAQ